MQIFYTYIISLVLIALADMTFLGFIMRDYYARLMSPAVTIEFSLVPAFFFYILFLLGLFIFAIYPGIVETNLQKTVIYGALFGFFCYMTYDLTNLATVKNWPLQLIFVDIFWGTFVSGVVSFLAYKIYFWF